MTFMKRLFVFVAISIATVVAQTAESIPFRAVLSPLNEVPAITGYNASGVGTVWLHIVRDPAGRIVSGTADFSASYRFPGDVTLTGMHIHRGAAGVNGPIVIDSAFRTTADATGTAGIARQQNPVLFNTAAITAATDMIADPSGFYFNIHSSVYPGGVIRGQMQRAEERVFLSRMSPANEVPPIAGLDASGVGAVTLLYSLDAEFFVTSAQATFDVSYTGFAEGTTFTGLHIHPGPAGMNGPVWLDTGISASRPVIAPASGSATITVPIEIDMTSANQTNTLFGLLRAPENWYINLHTSVNPGGAIRAQMGKTEVSTLRVTMLPANEVPPIGDLMALGYGVFRAWILRDATGAATAARTLFDVNYRFPGEVLFNGLHIHNGPSNVNGPVTINTGLSGAAPVMSSTGTGNIFIPVNVTTTAGLATLNSLLARPETHYINLHTSVHPGGAIRSQLAPINNARPNTAIVISAVSDPAYRTVAPGGLMAVYGTNLARVPGTLDGLTGRRIPTSLNGTTVSIAGRDAPLFSVDPGVIVAQVPVETPVGTQDVRVSNSNGAGSAAQVTVAAAAPGVFFDKILPDGNYRALVLRPLPPASFVTEDAPASRGSNYLLFTTGIPLTNPPQVTGEYSTSQTVRPVITVGGVECEILSSLAAPQFVGLSQTMFRIPASAPPMTGAQRLVVRVGDAVSNPTVIFMQ